MASRKLPTFYCPFPLVIHPRADDVHAVVLTWIRRFRLAEKPAAWYRLDGTRSDVLAAYAYPHTTFEQVIIAAEWMIWLFQFDDQFDEGMLGRQPERVAQVFQSMLGLLTQEGPATLIGPPERAEEALASALADLWQRTRALAQNMPAWRRRFVQSVADYFSAYCLEVEYRARRAIPDVETCIRTRYNSGSVPFLLALNEAFYGVELPTEFVASAPFQTLYHTAVNAICWANDIVSLTKELARDEVSNLVIAVRHERQCSWEEATEIVNDMCTAQIQLFEETEHQLFAHFPYPEPIRAAARYCVDGMHTWIRANLDWSMIAHRYAFVEESVSNQDLSYLETLLATPQAGDLHA